MKYVFSGFLICFFFSTVTLAALKTETVEYRDGKNVLEGFMVSDDNWTDQRPVIVIVHQWLGLKENEKMRATKLAEQGYVAFAVDIYGKENQPKNRDEARQLSDLYKGDIKLYRQRIKAALDFIAKNKKVDPKKIVIVGYCFGGVGALEAARAGFPVIGAVSFHGNLVTPQPQESKNIKSKLLIFHGALDPVVPFKDVDAFTKEMNGAKADYQFIIYSGAVHGFTQKEVGTDMKTGLAYNEAADKRSWEVFLSFLKEITK